jgi:hypothetical protein
MRLAGSPDAVVVPRQNGCPAHCPRCHADASRIYYKPMEPVEGLAEAKARLIKAGLIGAEPLFKRYQPVE